VVEDKTQRVANFTKIRWKVLFELMGATGLDNPEKLTGRMFTAACSEPVKTYDEIYPPVPEGSLLEGGDVPFDLRNI